MTVVVTHSTPSDGSFSATGAAAWDATHTLSGVGTMAGQDANNVTITGGTVNGTAVGATTAAAGSFTTLIGNSTSQFGKSSTNYLQAVGAATTVAPILSVQSSSDTNVDFSIKALGTGSVLLGSANGTAISASDAGATIAWWQFTGTATSTGNLISRVGGGGTNTTLISVAKGTGTIQFATANTATNVQFQVSNTASAVNYVQVTGSATGNKPTISALGSDANIDLTLTPKGTGRVNVTTSIKPKVNSAANVTSPLAWDSTSFDEYAITALANALTINADANAAPADGQRMMFRFKDNGTARALTWTTGSTNSFRVVGVTLPTTTVASKLVYIGCVYNVADSRWDAVAVSQEA